MIVEILSRSDSFNRHLATVLGRDAALRIRSSMPARMGLGGLAAPIALIHAKSFAGELDTMLGKVAMQPGIILGVAADVPEAGEMLALSKYGIRGYFNSYMADTHYQQMLQMLAAGQTWYAPPVLNEVIRLARSAVQAPMEANVLESLTPRERDIARLVARGLSNKEIANRYGIAEPTVKTHLTHIFEKLQVNDRVSLALMVSRASDPVAEPA